MALKPMQIKYTDIVKMRSTLKSFIRDWSTEVSQILSISSLFDYMAIFPIGSRGKTHELLANR